MAIDFRHPDEQGLWQAIAENAVFKFAVDAFQSVYMDLNDFAAAKGRNFLITKETYPYLYRLYRIAAERIGIEEDIPLYLTLSYSAEIETIGTDSDCFILISSSCLEKCTDKQLLALLGEELAHIRYKHIRLLNIHKAFELLLSRVPFARAGIEAFKVLLLEWRKYALFTSDRGAAIAAGDGDSAIKALSVRMGKEITGDCVDSIIEQYKESNTSKMGLVGKTVFQLMMDKIAVPFGVLRIIELKNWCASEECRELFPNIFFGTKSEFGFENFSDGTQLYNQYKILRSHNEERAMAMLHAAADLGSAPAQSCLGRYYISGKQGLERNYHEGLTLLRKASLSGDLSAYFSLGCCFKTGCKDFLLKDEKKAQWMFRLADDSGYSAAKGYRDINGPAELNEQIVVNLMDWFASNCKEGRCIINTANPHKGFSFDFETNSEIYGFLWIPRKEKIYAVECTYDSSDKLSKAIAITNTGIYEYAKSGIPFYMTWEELLNNSVDGLSRGNIITVRINGNCFCSYRADSSDREIGKLILRIKAALNKK